jgi:hypothetical protein
MANFPRVVTLKRGGKLRRTFMVQPYLAQGCYDVMRAVFMVTL